MGVRLGFLHAPATPTSPFQPQKPPDIEMKPLVLVQICAAANTVDSLGLARPFSRSFGSAPALCQPAEIFGKAVSPRVVRIKRQSDPFAELSVLFVLGIVNCLKE